MTPDHHLWVMHRSLHLIPVLTTTTDVQVINTNCRIVGFTFGETTGSAAASMTLVPGPR